MQNKDTILILGDSSSMTIGVERKMYPFLLADAERWPESTVLVNCSQPGITAADACAFYFRHKDNGNLKAVVIHLGNCDSMSSEIHKGRYTRTAQFMDRAKEKLGRPMKRTSLKNRLLRYQWNDTFDPEIERPERPEDYKFNISRMVGDCVKTGIPVLLLRPSANRLFPSGSGKGNFAFYKYLGIEDAIADQLSIPEPRFIKALKLHEQGDFNRAGKAYRDILYSSGPLAGHSEFPLIVANNFAVCAAREGDLEESERLLTLLLKERNARKEILLYNLAQVRRLAGDEQGYEKHMVESFESDCSMYRIRSPYRQALDKIAKRFNSGVKMIDIGSPVSADMYVDHCHPRPDGQAIIADNVSRELDRLGLTGGHRAEVENILYNPELAFGNTTEFYKYFKSYAPYDKKRIRQSIKSLAKACARTGDDDLKESMDFMRQPREIRWALEYHMKHPCFPTLGDLLRAGHEHPADVGRFPEFFLYRYLIPFLRLHREDEKLNSRFNHSLNLLREPESLAAVLPPLAREVVSTDAPEIDSELDRKRIPAILARVEKLLLSHLRQGNQIHERIKTTIFWYFRETLRFGSHSRTSMRYDRPMLEYTAEALAVAGVLDSRLDAKWAERIEFLIKTLEECAAMHEKHCENFSLATPDPELLKKYDKDLKKLADKLEKDES